MTTTTSDNIDGAAATRRPRKLRIACHSPPSSGHLNPIMNLAEGLVERNRTHANRYADGDGDNEVCIVTGSYGAEKIRTRCEALGIKLVSIDLGEGFESEVATTATSIKLKEGYFQMQAERSKTLVRESLDEFGPDVVVGDEMGWAAQDYAASRNIPIVINVPGSITVLNSFLRSAIHIDKESFWFSAGGLFLSYTPLTMFGILSWFNAFDLGTMCDKIRRFVNCGNSLVLVNSFWGFEKPHFLLQPNMFAVGSVAKPLPKPPDFESSHPELDVFLKTARASNRKILMVSTGSVIRMEEWLVKLLWEAFERLSKDYDAAIVWSLKEDRQEFLSNEQLQHPAFYFSKWLPQPALLASDLIDGVLTSCGWNGAQECVSGGKPVVVLPFMADQMFTAELLINAGCATAITTTFPTMNGDVSGKSSYAEPCSGFWKRLRMPTVTVDGVVKGCASLLTDPKYKVAAKKLQALSSGPGTGCSFACELIEHAGKHGVWHLTERWGDGSKDGTPRATTIANSLTGHRPLAMTLAMCAIAVVGTMQAVAWSNNGEL